MPSAAQAQLRFDQTGIPGTNGKALFGTLAAGLVTVTNALWSPAIKRQTFTVLDARGSAITRGVKQDNANQTWSFTPDVACCYLIQLDAYDAAGNRATHYLTFAVLNTNNRVTPPAMVRQAGFPEIDALAALDFSNGNARYQQQRGYAPFEEDYADEVETLVVGDTPTGPAGGSLGGTYPNPTVTNVDGAAGVTSVLAKESIWGPFNSAAVSGHVGSSTTTSQTDSLVTNDNATHAISTIAIPDLTTATLTAIVRVFQGAKRSTWVLTQSYGRNGAGAVADGTTQSNFTSGTNAGAPEAAFTTPTLTASGNNAVVTVQDTGGSVDYWTCEWTLDATTKVS